MARCDKNTKMRWQGWYVAIANKCTEDTFGFTGEYGAESIEGVESFRYLGRLLHRSENDCLAVRGNIWKARQVWGCLGKLLRREGVEPFVSEKFYRAVVQAVFLFGEET